jgi:hypothetical protein
VFLLLALPGAAVGQADGEAATFPGQPVTYFGADGANLGTVTLDAVHDPFTLLTEGREPGPGAKAVVVELTFEAPADGGFDVSPYKVYLRDSSGALWGRGFPGVSEDDYPVPELISLPVGPGSRVSGYVGFEVPADVQADEVFFEPEDGVLLRVGDLSAEAAPAVGEPVALGASNDAAATATVQAIEDPYKAFDRNRKPVPGARFVMVTLGVENTGDSSFEVDPNGVLLRDTAGRMWSRASVTPRKQPKIPELERVDMAPGNLVTGRVGYQIPASSTLEGLYYQGGGHLTRLAGLTDETAGPEPPPDEATGPPLGTVECEVLEGWWQDVSPLLDRLLDLPWFQADAAAMDEAASRGLLRDVAAIRADHLAVTAPPILVNTHRRFLGGLSLYEDSARLQLDAQESNSEDLLRESQEVFEAAQLATTDAMGWLAAMGGQDCDLEPT